MIDEFFRCTVMKEPPFAMGTNTDDIHIDHLVEMNDPVLHVFIIYQVALEIGYIIQQSEFFHIGFNSCFLRLHISGCYLEQVKLCAEGADQFMQQSQVFGYRVAEIMYQQYIPDDQV